MDSSPTEACPAPAAPVPLERASADPVAPSRRFFLAVACSCTFAVMLTNGVSSALTRRAITSVLDAAWTDSKTWRSGQQARLEDLDAFVRLQFAQTREEIGRLVKQR